MDHLTKEQAEELVQKLQTSTEGFSLNNKQVFLPFITPTSKIIYADLYGHWSKEYGIHRRQPMDPLAIIVDEVLYCDKPFLEFLSLEENESLKEISTEYKAYCKRVKDFATTSIIPNIPKSKEVSSQLEKTAFQCARRKLLTPYNISHNNWFVKSTEDLIQEYFFRLKDFVFCLSSATSPEDYILKKWQEYEHQEDSYYFLIIQEQISLEHRIAYLCNNPESCTKEWELDLSQRLGELLHEGAKTVTCTFVNESDEFVVKQEIEKLLEYLIYNGGTYKNNSQLTEVLYRGQNILGYDIPRENTLVANTLSL